MGRWVPMAERQGGTVLAVALSPNFVADRLAFAATPTGIFRSPNGGRSWEICGEGLSSFMIQSIAFSPSFPADRTLFAGAADGSVYRSTDAGDSWTVLAKVGGGSAVAALAAAPRPRGGSTMWAGTLADGLFATADGGQKWTARNSGLPDLSVIALALSPAFAEDQTGFVATASGLQLTTDGGRSWREVLTSPAEDGLQCVEVSPGFSTDRTVFVGTERQGVLCSSDGGTTWHPINTGLPELCINALALSPDFPEDPVVVAATGRGVAMSTDGGASWRVVAAESEIALSLDLSPGGSASPAAQQVILAGLIDRGLIRSEDGGRVWEAANQGLSASSLIGLAPSPGVEADATLFAWGSFEGVFRLEEGGQGWQPASEGLEGIGVASLALSPSFDTDGALYAATSAGVFHSPDRGTTWHSLGLEDQEVSLLTLSPAFPEDPLMAAAIGKTLYWSSKAGTGWRELEVPAGDETLAALALAIDSRGQRVLLAATWREPSGDRRGRLRVWSRTLPFSPWVCLFSRDTAARIAVLGVPDSFGEDQKFFIGNGECVYRLARDARERTREGERPLWLPGWVGSRGYPVVSLTAAPNFAHSRTLLAASGEGVFVSRDEGALWRRLGPTPGGRSPIAVAPSPGFAENGTVYALTLGGQLWRWDPAG